MSINNEKELIDTNNINDKIQNDAEFYKISGELHEEMKTLSYPTRLTAKNKEFFHGHRARERERFLKTPFGKVTKRDLLEVILYYCNSRADTKPIATRILEYTQNNIQKVLFFEEHDINNIKGLGDSFLCLVRVMREIISNSFKEELEAINSTVFSNWDTVKEYIKINMSNLNVEHFRMLVLGSKNQLIKDCFLSQGTVNHASVYVREIVKLVLDNFGVSVILVHNHPSGDTTPSQSDIEITKAIVNALNSITVRVQDHFIVGKDSIYSFLDNKLL